MIARSATFLSATTPILNGALCRFFPARLAQSEFPTSVAQRLNCCQPRPERLAISCALIASRADGMANRSGRGWQQFNRCATLVGNSDCANLAGKNLHSAPFRMGVVADKNVADRAII